MRGLLYNAAGLTLKLPGDISDNPIMSETKVQLAIPGREELSLDVSGEKPLLTGVGDLAFLKLLKDYRVKLESGLDLVQPPEGKSTGELMLREAILRAQGKWDFPFKEDETCHCRVVSTEKVNQAILVGAHTPREVSEMTSASTACGTCRPDVEAMIEYRLKN